MQYCNAYKKTKEYISFNLTKSQYIIMNLIQKKKEKLSKREEMHVLSNVNVDYYIIIFKYTYS